MTRTFVVQFSLAARDREDEMILFIGSSVVKKRSLISTLKRLNGSRKEKGSNIGVFSATQLISFVPLNI